MSNNVTLSTILYATLSMMKFVTVLSQLTVDQVEPLIVMDLHLVQFASKLRGKNATMFQDKNATMSQDNSVTMFQDR